MKKIPRATRAKAARIKLLLLDVDGVLTDGRIIIDDRGVETKQFHVRDGQGISLLRRAGIEVGFVTGRNSKVVEHRAKELGVQLVYQGVADKSAVYSSIKRKLRLQDAAIAYVGDDLIDLPILKQVGLAIAVADCCADLIPFVDYQTLHSGGQGAVREAAELLLSAQGKRPRIL